MTQQTTTPEPCSTIHSALCACMAEVEAIGKNRQNQEQRYKYRGIDDLYNSLHPLFARHRIFITCDVLTLERSERTTGSGKLLNVVHGTYRVTFHAEDGTSVSVVSAGEAMDLSDKATNKASSAALKYALMQTLLIPTEEAKDSEVDSLEAVAAPPRATEAELARCAAAIRERGSEEPYRQLRAVRTLTATQDRALQDLLAEVLFAGEAPADRPTELPRQQPSARGARETF
jgi:hypothetical protein